MASIETASRLALDPLPDVDAWMPEIDGIAPPATIGDAGPAATAGDPGLLDPALPQAGPAGNAASALTGGPVAEDFAGARRLTGPAGATVVIDPELDAYYFESTRLTPIAALLQLPASAWTPVYSKSLAETRASSAPQPLARLRWFAGLVASPGVLAPALDPHARYQLIRWATIEREFPRHFRIAKQFLGHALTIDAAAAAADVSRAEVVDYVNAGIAGRRLKVVA